jgi:branched-chain amino acid transport system ATP-binding protein
MLTAENVAVSFGGVRAVDGVSVSVADEEVVGLVGPNGSGKTTFLNALSGMVKASGRMEVDGKQVSFSRPRHVWRAGVARVFQAPQTFLEGLSVIDNVLLSSDVTAMRGLGASTIGRPAMWRRERDRWRHAMDCLEVAGLADLAEAPAGSLTYGQQRMLELCRTVAGNPMILLLDEPSAGLNDAETAELAQLLGNLRTRKIAMLLIDHKIDFVDSMCDRVVVLDLGRVIAEGCGEAVWRNPHVMTAYLGLTADAAS